MDHKYRLILYNGQCTSDYYNKFYHPVLCHICKRWEKESLPCELCNNIVYCCQLHRSLYETEHLKLCKSSLKCLWLLLICRQRGPLILSDNLVLSRRTIGKLLMEFVEEDLGRKLQLFEKQMLIFSKVCLICHKARGVSYCEGCYSVFYCEDHVVQFHDEHEQTHCNNIMLSLNLDIASIDRSIFTLNIDLSNFPKTETPFNDMDSFFMKYIFPTRLMNQSWTLLDHFNSDYISAPLTVHSGMHEAQLLNLLNKESFIVHVIAANDLDRYSLPAWEILLHLSRKTKNIVIIMIGPELPFDCGKFQVCEICEMHGQILNYEYHFMLYHNYVGSPMYIQPDIIIGFQADFCENVTTWNESLLALQAQMCPLFLTNVSVNSIRNDIHKIQEVLGANVTPIFEIENRYKACRPYKILEYEFYYRNSWLIYYKHLHNFDLEIVKLSP